MICFYFPYYNQPGGVQKVIINLSSYLSERNIDFKLIDLTNGFIYKELIKININFIFIEKNKNFENHISDDDVLLTTSSECLLDFKNSNPRVLIWNVFPDTIITSFNFIRGKRIPLLSVYFQRQLMQLLDVKRSIVFMDNDGIDIVKEFTKRNYENLHILPIPFLFPEKKPINRKIKREFNITYVGRAIDWKIFPCLTLINILNKSSLDKNIVIHIFTDNILKFKKEIHDKITIDNNSISLKFYQNIHGVKLKEMLNNISDLHTGMGTACFEGASLGIPTIVTELSYRIINNYKFKWLYELDGYQLGNPVFSKNYIMGQHNLVDIIKELELEKKWEYYSKKCYYEAKKKFDINIIGERFVDSTNKAYARVTDIKKFSIKLFPIFQIAKFFLSKILFLSKKR